VGRHLWREDGSVLCIILLALASVVFLGSESLWTHNHILLSQIRDFPFRRLLRLAGSRWRYSTTLRLAVSQSVSLGVQSHLQLITRYLLLFDSYGLVFVWRHLWRNDGSVFCICCWPSPALSFWGPSPLGTIYSWLLVSDTNTENKSVA
jgi:hypothetical protein